MKVIGITGQIGCGKTTIAGILRHEGYLIFDADKECRKLYTNSSFLQKIKVLFPAVFENDVFNKKKLREFVFANQSGLKDLEGLIHPILKDLLLKTIRKNSQREVLIFIDAALLFEMGWNKYCTNILLATAPYDIQKQRVMTRDGISEEQFENIVKIQKEMSEIQKMSADYVVETDKTNGVLKASLLKLIGDIQC